MARLLANPIKLARQGYLGINRRNLDYINRYNSRANYNLVDNKIKSKQLLGQADIATPELIMTIDTYHGINRAIERLTRLGKGFVIKPTHGRGGKGILVITSVEINNFGTALFRAPGGKLLHQQTIKQHLSNIISGLFSLGDRSDIVMIEELIEPASPLSDLVLEGIPDIRIIAFRGYPIMGMARLPTLISGGRANLHQGAVGAGIRHCDGTINGGIYRDQAIIEHPDTLVMLDHQQVPSWQSMLGIAALAYDLTRIGFLGVDLVLDSERGPLVLELNARPGLNIQLANRLGLRARLDTAKHWPGDQSTAIRVKRVLEAFA